MGCTDSKGVQSPIKMDENASSTSRDRARIMEAIQKNDNFLISRVFRETNGDPGWSLIPSNPGWNAFHQCCQKNSVEMLGLLIQQSHTIKAGRVFSQLNQRDKNGLTPAMICCMNDAYDSFGFLLHFNLINMKIMNKDRRSVITIALNYSQRCRNLLKEENIRKIVSQSPENEVINFLKNPSVQTEGDRRYSSSASSQSEGPQNNLEKIKNALSEISENFKIYGILAEMTNDTENFVDEEFSSETKLDRVESCNTPSPKDLVP